MPLLNLGAKVVMSADTGCAPMRSALEAVVAGYEVAGAMERRLGKETMRGALRASPLYGTVAAAAGNAGVPEGGCECGRHA